MKPLARKNGNDTPLLHLMPCGAPLMSTLCLLLAVGCTLQRPDERVQKRNPDLVAQAKVKAALTAEPSLSAAAISVDCTDRVVTLGGFVETEAQRRRAAQVADDVRGVDAVINNIKVKWRSGAISDSPRAPNRSSTFAPCSHHRDRDLTADQGYQASG